MYRYDILFSSLKFTGFSDTLPILVKSIMSSLKMLDENKIEEVFYKFKTKKNKDLENFFKN
jgi:hypothetical protein